MARPSVAESHVGNEWVTRAGEGQRGSVTVGPCVRGTGEPQMDPREGGEGTVDRCEGPMGRGVVGLVGGASSAGQWRRGGGASGTQKREGGRALMAFPERKRGKVPGRDKVGGRAGPGRGSRTPGFVRVSGAASCPAGAPGVRPDPAPLSHGPGPQLPPLSASPRGRGSVGDKGEPEGALRETRRTTEGER